MNAKYFLNSERPSWGPHESDTLNGRVYRLLTIDTNGDIAHVASYAERWFDKHANDKARWSWGNAAIVAETAYDAEKLASAALGDRFAGFVR
jgi:hypothetical protein